MFRHPVKLHQAMLGVAPKRFNTVNMPRTTDKLIVTMMYPEMFGKTHVNQSLITAPTVGIDDTPDTDRPLMTFCSVALEASGTISV